MAEVWLSHQPVEASSFNLKFRGFFFAANFSVSHCKGMSNMGGGGGGASATLSASECLRGRMAQPEMDDDDAEDADEGGGCCGGGGGAGLSEEEKAKRREKKKRQKAAKAARKKAERPPPGISLAGFQAFIDAHGGRGAFCAMSTADVKYKQVIPITGHKRKSYVAHLLEQQAEANKFISHAYEYRFLDVVDAIAAWEARQSTGGPFFYYFDLLVVNQHGQSAVVDFKVLRDEFGGSVRAIGHTLLVLKWENPIPLSRAWCVFEMGVTLDVRAKMEVIMPPQDAASFKRALVEDFDSLTLKTCRVDVEKAKAREVKDMANIQRAIRESGGYLKTNQLVIGAMKDWMVWEARAELANLKVVQTAAEGDKKCTLICRLGCLLISLDKLGEVEELWTAPENLALFGLSKKRLSWLENNELTGGGRVSAEASHAPNPAVGGGAGGFSATSAQLDLKVNALDFLGNFALLRSLQAQAPRLSMSTACFSYYYNASRLFKNWNTVRIQQAHKGDAGVRLIDLVTLNSRAVHLICMATSPLLAPPAYLPFFEPECERQGDLLVKAEKILREVLKPGCLVDGTATYLDSKANLAIALDELNKLADTKTQKDALLSEAEKLHKEVLEACLNTPSIGKDHPDALRAYHNLGNVLMKKGNFSDAEFFYRTALEGKSRVLGNEHISTLKSQTMLDKTKLLRQLVKK